MCSVKTLLFWLGSYRPSTHTLAGLLTLFQSAYLADADVQRIVNRILDAHPVVHAMVGYSLLVLALYRNGAAGNNKEKESNENDKQI